MKGRDDLWFQGWREGLGPFFQSIVGERAWGKVGQVGLCIMNAELTLKAKTF